MTLLFKVKMCIAVTTGLEYLFVWPLADGELFRKPENNPVVTLEMTEFKFNTPQFINLFYYFEK